MSGILVLIPGSFVTHKDSANLCVSSENWGVIVSDRYIFRGWWAVKKASTKDVDYVLGHRKYQIR